MNAFHRLLHRHQQLATLCVLGVLGTITVHYLFAPAYGYGLGNRSLSLGTAEVSTDALYSLNFNLVSNAIVGSIEVQFCSNSALQDDPCIAPAGFDASRTALIDQAGPTGFTISTASDANTIILTRPPALTASGLATYSFQPIKNPSAPGSYYARVQTFATADASGPYSDYGGIAFAITNLLSISAQVPPYLLFCTGITVSGFNCANALGNYIDFGEFSSSRASTASSQMLVATNAGQGYAISIAGTTLASGNNVIAALVTGDVSRPSTGQFGFNLRANSAPSGGSDVAGPGTSLALTGYNQPNIFRFAPGDTIVSSDGPDDIRVYTSDYVANVPRSQSPGIYVSTVTYVCLAKF